MIGSGISFKNMKKGNYFIGFKTKPEITDLDDPPCLLPSESQMYSLKKRIEAKLDAHYSFRPGPPAWADSRCTGRQDNQSPLEESNSVQQPANEVRPGTSLAFGGSI